MSHQGAGVDAVDLRDPGLHGSPRDDQSDRREQCHDEKETGEAQQRPDCPEFGLSEDKNCHTEKRQRGEQRNDGDPPDAAPDQRVDARAPAQNYSFEHGSPPAPAASTIADSAHIEA